MQLNVSLFTAAATHLQHISTSPLHCCYHAFAFGNLKLQSHSRKVASSADHYPARNGDNVFSHLQFGYSLINFPTVAATVVDLVR